MSWATGIDLFAGLGGFTEAGEQVGIDVRWAANHWAQAVEVHKQNHPNTQHSCQDLFQADWTQAPKHDICLASPCCQGHSKARGKDKPVHDASRATAWAVVSCAEVHRPAFVVVENVPEFLEWALYPAWSDAMGALGYAQSVTTMDVADCGVPQNRMRAFMVFSRSKNPIFIPKPTVPHVPISQVIRWSEGKWSLIDRPGRAEPTLARVARARKEFGSRFVMPYYRSGSGLTGRSLDRPIGTITTRDRWALVNGDYMRMFLVAEYREAMGFRADYRLPKTRKPAIHMLGNAVPPPAAAYVLNELRKAA